MTRVRANEGAELPSVDEVVAIVVLGGMQGAYQADRYPYLDDEMRLIREAASADLPTLGICLGAQLMAAALGGTSLSLRGGGGRLAGCGPYRRRITGPADPRVDLPCSGVASRHLRAPTRRRAARRVPGTRSLSAGCSVGVQFHPEASPEVLAEWVSRTPEGTFDADGINPEIWLRQARDMSDEARAVSMRFFAAWLDEVADAAS